MISAADISDRTLNAIGWAVAISTAVAGSAWWIVRKMALFALILSASLVALPIGVFIAVFAGAWRSVSSADYFIGVPRQSKGFESMYDRARACAGGGA